MNRDLAAVLRENEQLRAAVREVEAQRHQISATECLARVATALDQRDGALALAVRIVSVLMLRQSKQGVVLVGDSAPEIVLDLGPDDMAEVDGTRLQVETLDEGKRHRLTLHQKVALVQAAASAGLLPPEAVRRVLAPEDGSR